MYKNILKKKGIAVKSVSEPASDSPFSSLIERIIEWMDEYYLINLSGEVRRGMKEKATRGEALGRAPYGYRVENKMYIPDENADVVQYIFARYASGTGYMALRRELEEKGITTLHGKKPTVHMVQYILHNPAYIGKIRWSENGRLNHRHPLPDEEADSVVYVDGKHEPLIDMETWNIVQEKLRQRNNETKYRRKGGRMYLLKGLLRCGDCGCTLISATEKTLQCCGYGRGVCHVSHSLSIQKADETVIALLKEIVRTDSYVFSPSAVPAPKIRRDWDSLIAAEERKLSRARDAYLAGVFQMDEYSAAKAGIEANLAKLKRGQDMESDGDDCERTVDIAAYHDKVMAVLELVENEAIDDQARNEALRSVLDKIVFHKPQGNFDFYFVP